MDVPSVGILFPSVIAVTRLQAEETLTTACSVRLQQEMNIRSQQRKNKTHQHEKESMFVSTHMFGRSLGIISTVKQAFFSKMQAGVFTIGR